MQQRPGEPHRPRRDASDDLPWPVPADVPAGDSKVIRAFFRNRRLTVIPARGAKRLVVLRYLAAGCLPEERDYPEKEVNQLLALVHPDVAALRRYLVDAGFVTRRAGQYRRVTTGAREADPAAD